MAKIQQPYVPRNPETLKYQPPRTGGLTPNNNSPIRTGGLTPRNNNFAQPPQSVWTGADNQPTVGGLVPKSYGDPNNVSTQPPQNQNPPPATSPINRPATNTPTTTTPRPGTILNNGYGGRAGVGQSNTYDPNAYSNSQERHQAWAAAGYPSRDRYGRELGVSGNLINYNFDDQARYREQNGLVPPPPPPGAPPPSQGLPPGSSPIGRVPNTFGNNAPPPTGNTTVDPIEWVPYANGAPPPGGTDPNTSPLAQGLSPEPRRFQPDNPAGNTQLANGTTPPPGTSPRVGNGTQPPGTGQPPPPGTDTGSELPGGYYRAGPDGRPPPDAQIDPNARGAIPYEEYWNRVGQQLQTSQGMYVPEDGALPNPITPDQWAQMTGAEQYLAMQQTPDSTGYHPNAGNPLQPNEQAANVFRQQFGDPPWNPNESGVPNAGNQLYTGYGDINHWFGEPVASWAIDPSRIIYNADGSWTMELGNIRGPWLAQQQEAARQGRRTRGFIALAVIATAGTYGYLNYGLSGTAASSTGALATGGTAPGTGALATGAVPAGNAAIGAGTQGIVTGSMWPAPAVAAGPTAGQVALGATGAAATAALANGATSPPNTQPPPAEQPPPGNQQQPPPNNNGAPPNAPQPTQSNWQTFRTYVQNGLMTVSAYNLLARQFGWPTIGGGTNPNGSNIFDPSNIIQDGAGLYNANRNLDRYQNDVRRAVDRGDYNAQYRPGYLSRLNDFQLNPEKALQDPTFKAVRERNLENLSRQYNARGMALSGNEMGALAAYGQELDWAQIEKERESLRRSANLGDPGRMAVAEIEAAGNFYRANNNISGAAGQTIDRLFNTSFGGKTLGQWIEGLFKGDWDLSDVSPEVREILENAAEENGQSVDNWIADFWEDYNNSIDINIDDGSGLSDYDEDGDIDSDDWDYWLGVDE